MPTDISQNLDHVRGLIASSANTHRRKPEDIELLAVSKTKPVSDIMLAYQSGQRHFGENYVQEGVDKIEQLKLYSDIVWHFIGPLQSNKSRLVAENFDWMHSIDRYKIAKRIDDQRSVYKAALNVCIQVNIDNEQSKAGVAAADVLELAEQISSLPRLKLRGLMAIPKANQDKQTQKQSFDKMGQLFLQCQQKFSEFDTLSIGMSGDLDVAIECGSTIVRVGTAIFGARS